MKTRNEIAGAVFAVGLVLGVGSVFAGTVGSYVSGINALSSENYVEDITGGANAAEGASDVVVASGVIDNNYGQGWKLTVSSANNGLLVRSGGGAFAYNEVKLVQTGGTLGNGLSNPDQSSKAIGAGSCFFDTGDGSAASSATVGYAFELRVSWAAQSDLLEGSYTDEITMTLTVDDD